LIYPLIRDEIDFFDHTSQTEWHKSLQSSIVHWIGINGDTIVLDAGCGSGQFILRLAQRAKSAMGLDINPLMLKRAQYHATYHNMQNASFLEGDLCHIPMPDNSANLIVCFNTLFMFRNPEIVLSELVRVSEPGGSIVLANPSLKMDLWTAQKYCDRNKMYDFDRDSLLAVASTAMRLPPLDETGWAKVAEQSGATLDSSHYLMDGLMNLKLVIPHKKIVPNTTESGLASGAKGF